jgi:hypothetical protein
LLRTHGLSWVIKEKPKVAVRHILEALRPYPLQKRIREDLEFFQSHCASNGYRSWSTSPNAPKITMNVMISVSQHLPLSGTVPRWNLARAKMLGHMEPLPSTTKAARRPPPGRPRTKIRDTHILQLRKPPYDSTLSAVACNC